MLTDTKLHNFKPKDKLYKVNDREVDPDGWTHKLTS